MDRYSGVYRGHRRERDSGGTADAAAYSTRDYVSRLRDFRRWAAAWGDRAGQAQPLCISIVGAVGGLARDGSISLKDPGTNRKNTKRDPSTSQADSFAAAKKKKTRRPASVGMTRFWRKH